MKRALKILGIAILSTVFGAIVASLIFSRQYTGIERMDDI